MTASPLTGHDVSELYGLAIELAADAAQRHFDGGLGAVDTKSSTTDPVTMVDRDSERIIVDGIRKARPADSILGEEGAAVRGTTGVRWIIDPLDGTVNYLYGFPSYSVSIAVAVGDQTVVGVVHDTSRDEVFAARLGAGATLDGAAIQVSTLDEPSTALLGTGFGYERETRLRQAAVAAQLIPDVRDIRRAGSCAIDLCAVACGRLDGYYETGPHEWDVAAGGLIVTEAGGRFEWAPDTNRVMASGAALWTPLGDLIERAEQRADSVAAHLQP